MIFEGPEGECTLGDLFRGRSQLAIYHFMLTPGSDHVCPGCSFIADHVDAARQHFEQADLSFAAVSRVSFRPEDIAAGRAIYNYGTMIRNSQDMFGTSIFVKDEGGAVFHTYSTYH